MNIEKNNRKSCANNIKSNKTNLQFALFSHILFSICEGKEIVK